MTGRLCPLLAHSVGSLRRINSVAIGAKRTLGASTIAAASIIRNNFAYLHSSFLDGLDGSGRHLDFKKCLILDTLDKLDGFRPLLPHRTHPRAAPR